MACPQYALLVDSYLSAQYLANEFRKHGVIPIHLQSTSQIPLAFRPSFQVERFDDNLIWSNIQQLENRFQREKIVCVVAGTELGIELADHLSEQWELPGNGSSMSFARRDKFQMGNTLAQSQINVPQQLKSNELPEIIQWMQNNNVSPLVLKPLNSIGSDGVYICDDVAELSVAFKKLIHQKNALDSTNTHLLAQEYLVGQEYIVNTFSAHGHHYFSDMWHCHKKRKPGSGMIALKEELLTSKNELFHRLLHFSQSVLNALQIQHGPAHLEIMMTPKGPFLIEMTPRIHGSLSPQSMKQVLGTNHIHLTVETYLNPEKIIKLSSTHYMVHQWMYHSFLHTHETGTMKAPPNSHAITKLESCAHVDIRVQKGDEVFPSSSLCHNVGIVDLIHKEKQQLQKDYQKLRDIEKFSLLTLEKK